jgi:hypothetical protein
LVLLVFLYLFWPESQVLVPKVPEIEEDWIDHLSSGYFAVDNMNRLIIFASENNFELDYNDIDILEMNNPKYLHNILSQESTQMINIINKLNNINNLILENIVIWLFSYEKIPFESTNKEEMNLFWKNITNIKQRFGTISIEFIIEESFYFQKFSSNIIQLLTKIYSTEKNNNTIEIDQLRLSEQFNSENEEEHLTLNILQINAKYFEQMIILYENNENTKNIVEQALKDVREARQRHDNVSISLGQIIDKNQTLRVQRIERKQKLQLILNIIEEINKLHKNWADFHDFLSKFSHFIQLIKKVCCFSLTKIVKQTSFFSSISMNNYSISIQMIKFLLLNQNL